MFIRNLVMVLTGLLPVAGSAATLNININNSKNDVGVIKVLVFSKANKDAFPREIKPDMCISHTKINKGNAIVSCQNLAKGKYAVSVIHDENENGEVDHGFFGPKEGFGFSNNAKPHFGPPDYEDAEFEITEDIYQLSISMQYF